MSIKDRILKALNDGPGLSGELAAEFEMDQRKMNANLASMIRHGHIIKKPFYQHGIANGMQWLYSLKEYR